jgi:pimeloyl-ACP methyl ester carboxylesterase
MLQSDISDALLVERLPGFKSSYSDLDEVRLHHVCGGDGPPLVLIGGWPQTWWQYHHIMPALAQRFHVIAVDMRGQGGSSKPELGYDKKTLAADIYGVTQNLGFNRINIVGHDIGSMVAYSFAVNYPQSTSRLAMLDIPHPFEGFASLSLIPRAGVFDSSDPHRPSYPWWFAFNQVPDLPEALLEGRVGLLLNWIYDYLAKHKEAIADFDRAVYTAAYEQPGAMRSGNAFYKAFRQDIEDLKSYQKPTLPVLGMARANNPLLRQFFDLYVPHAIFVEVPNCGHWLAEERPAEVIAAFLEFF